MINDFTYYEEGEVLLGIKYKDEKILQFKKIDNNSFFINIQSRVFECIKKKYSSEFYLPICGYSIYFVYNPEHDKTCKILYLRGENEVKNLRQISIKENKLKKIIKELAFEMNYRFIFIQGYIFFKKKDTENSVLKDWRVFEKETMQRLKNISLSEETKKTINKEINRKGVLLTPELLLKKMNSGVSPTKIKLNENQRLEIK